MSTVINFKPDSHDEVFNLIIKNGNYYNDDTDLVENGDNSSTIAIFSQEDGYITGIEIISLKTNHLKDIKDMFKSITVENVQDTEIKITANGEITQNTETKMYTVWDETYSDWVAKTKYLEVAKDALSSYANHYLRGEL